jgi:hypothetical protein
VGSLRAADPERLYAWYEEHLSIGDGPREMLVSLFTKGKRTTSAPADSKPCCI